MWCRDVQSSLLLSRKSENYLGDLQCFSHAIGHSCHKKYKCARIATVSISEKQNKTYHICDNNNNNNNRHTPMGVT